MGSSFVFFVKISSFVIAKTIKTKAAAFPELLHPGFLPSLLPDHPLYRVLN